MFNETHSAVLETQCDLGIVQFSRGGCASFWYTTGGCGSSNASDCNFDLHQFGLPCSFGAGRKSHVRSPTIERDGQSGTEDKIRVPSGRAAPASLNVDTQRQAGERDARVESKLFLMS